MTITVRVDGYRDNCQNKRCMTITDSKSKWIRYNYQGKRCMIITVRVNGYKDNSE